MDGVERRLVASQGVPVCIFDPEAGDPSNEKVLVRLKRDASRSKVLAAMLLPPMASWEWLPREGLAAALLGRHGEPGPFVATRHRNLTRLPRLYFISCTPAHSFKSTLVSHPYRTLATLPHSGITELTCSSESGGGLLCLRIRNQRIP